MTPLVYIFAVGACYAIDGGVNLFAHQRKTCG